MLWWKYLCDRTSGHGLSIALKVQLVVELHILGKMRTLVTLDLARDVRRCAEHNIGNSSEKKTPNFSDGCRREIHQHFR